MYYNNDFEPKKIVKLQNNRLLRISLLSKVFGNVVTLDVKKYMISVCEYGTYIDCFLSDGTIKNYDYTYWSIIDERIVD